DDFAPMRLRDIHRLALRSRGRRNREMGTSDQDRPGRGHEAFIDVILAQRAVGAVVAVEDERESVLVAHAEQYQGREALAVDHNTTRVDSLARELLPHESPHRLLAHAADQRRLE